MEGSCAAAHGAFEACEFLADITGGDHHGHAVADPFRAFVPRVTFAEPLAVEHRHFGRYYFRDRRHRSTNSFPCGGASNSRTDAATAAMCCRWARAQAS